MQVKIKTNLGTNQFPEMPYRDGDLKEVSDDVGAMLVRKGWAEEVAQVKAVPRLDIAATEETSTPEVPAVKQKPKGGK